MRRLACCHRNKGISVDFDEEERIMTYNGLESCMLSSCSYDNDSGRSRIEGCITDSLDEDASSCSSTKDALGSLSPQWLLHKREKHESDEWVTSFSSPIHKDVKPAYTMKYSDIETMKERFAKLLLGDDSSGGCKGVSTALALSNAITNLAASVFGELWKLEPLEEELKNKWKREMDWFLSPTNYMVELVPAKQSGSNGGGTIEIMKPKARSDINMNLPALQKLDSILIETLDSMVNMEFWYAEGYSRAEGRNGSSSRSRKWWLPSPRVPSGGLSQGVRKKLISKGKLIHQVLKATNAINEQALMEMPVPTTLSDALPKSIKANLGEDLHRAVTITESNSMDEVLLSLNIKNEHNALEIANQLESALLVWKHRISDEASSRSPLRTPWSFVRDSMSEINKMEIWIDRAEFLLQLLKNKYPNMPQTFINATKVQHNKDVGHSIIEAYSRVLRSLAGRMLLRALDILQEDEANRSNHPADASKFDCLSILNLSGICKTPVIS